MSDGARSHGRVLDVRHGVEGATPRSTPDVAGQLPSAALDTACQVADAVLYEGYVLFPYRASTTKNRYRWQFGVLVPAAQVEAGSSEPDHVLSETLLRTTGAGARVEVTARFLHPCHRQVERRGVDGFAPVEELTVDGELVTTWDEGVEHAASSGPVTVADLLVRPHRVDITVTGSRDEQPLGDDGAARLVRTTAPLTATLTLQAAALDDDVVRLTTTLHNLTGWSDPSAPRDDVVRHALVGAHLLLVADQARFASLIDPADWALPWAESCTNRNTYPVLVGEADGDEVVLSSPIILSDHPEIAPESIGDSYDATEIDELLTLATMSLTDEEKRSARATDPRAAEVVDRAGELPPAVLERLHGALRQFDPPRDPRLLEGPATHEPGLDAELAEFLGVGEAPIETTDVGGVEVAVGDRIVVRPNRRADAQDVFVAGRTATVERIVTDVEGTTHLAVTVDDDPAQELHRWYGRHLYFQPDEIEPLTDDRETP